MFPIVNTKWLTPDVKWIDVHAPRIAKKQQAGQFVIVRVHDHGERIPLTIAQSDFRAGTISLIVQGIGKTTHLLNRLETGQSIRDVVGPLGKPSEIHNYGTCVVIAGGVGAAIAWPIALALKTAGNHVIIIAGSKCRERMILETELQAASDQLLITTDDGSYGEAGFVTDQLEKLMQHEKIQYVLAIGPVPMMQAVAELTRPANIPTTVSLNSIMIDGTGMCGGCRVLLGDQSKFACVDGPEFNAHEVDFQVLAQRNRMYRNSEQLADKRFTEDPEHDLALVQQQSLQFDNHECQIKFCHPEQFQDD